MITLHWLRRPHPEQRVAVGPQSILQDAELQFLWRRAELAYVCASAGVILTVGHTNRGGSAML